MKNVGYYIYGDEEGETSSMLFGVYRRQSYEYSSNTIIDKDTGELLKFWLVEEGDNLEFACRIFTERGMTMFPCGFSLIFCHQEDKEKIRKNLWKVLKTFKDRNCFFWTGEMLLDVSYDANNYDH